VSSSSERASASLWCAPNGARGKRVDAANRVDRFFHLACDVGLYGFRRGTRIIGLDHNDGKGDVGGRGFTDFTRDALVHCVSDGNEAKFTALIFGAEDEGLYGYLVQAVIEREQNRVLWTAQAAFKSLLDRGMIQR